MAMREAFARADAGVWADGHDWRPAAASEADDAVAAERGEPAPTEDGGSVCDEMAEWAAAAAAAPVEEALPWEEDMENEMMEHELWAGGREPFGDG